MNIAKTAKDLPDDIFAMFLCHGIAANREDSNAANVLKVNYLGHQYFLQLALEKVVDYGSVNIISSAGGFGWEGKDHSYVTAKQALCAYVKSKVHAPEYIDRRIRLNVINPGCTKTGLTDDFNRSSSPTGDLAEGEKNNEAIFLASWNGHWATPDEMGYPLVAIGSKLFSYVSGQIMYIDYGQCSTWETAILMANNTQS